MEGLLTDTVQALAILTLMGVDLQIHFLAELPADHAADAVRRPASGLNQHLKYGTGLPADQLQDGCLIAIFSRTLGVTFGRFRRLSLRARIWLGSATGANASNVARKSD